MMIKQIFEEQALNMNPASTPTNNSGNSSNSLPAPLKLEVKSPLASGTASASDDPLVDDDDG